MGLPTRPLLLSEAGDALKFVEAASAQTFLFGFVMQSDPTGRTFSVGSFDHLSVHAEGVAGHFQTELGAYGYSLILPPGEYELWVQQEEAMVSSKKMVRLIKDPTKKGEPFSQDLFLNKPLR
jgi:hypothetical protein